MTKNNLSVVMLGSSGAVGGEVARTLSALPAVPRLTLLGRRRTKGIHAEHVSQPMIDALQPTSYEKYLSEHTSAVCTLGVGQPSKVSKEQFLRVDQKAVLEFAQACKRAGVRHFELLSSVGAEASSASFFLRAKGELENGLRLLNFERLSLFHPSMILTPTNRYGLSQALTLAVWPHLKPALLGPLRKFRGIGVEQLGRAMAQNLFNASSGEETLEWDDIVRLDTGPTSAAPPAE